MNLYSFTLKESSSITHISGGSFLNSKSQDLALVKSSQIIELWTLDLPTERLKLRLKIDTFSQIRHITNYRTVGAVVDSLIISSDSGHLTVLQFFDDNGTIGYKIIIQEVISKTGCRRVALGSYIAKDSKGRAIMLSAIERSKTVFLTQVKEKDGAFTLSSPLEANHMYTICYDLVDIDVEYDNPSFVALEAEYGDIDDKNSTVSTGVIIKQLLFYQVDLGLNHVVKANSVEVDPTSNMLLDFPGPNNTSVVMVAAAGSLTVYSNRGELIAQQPFPLRIDQNTNNLLIVNKCIYKRKNYLLYLVQNSKGDVFKVEYTNQKISVVYLFTSPALTGLTIFKTGFVFLACSSADHRLYSIKHLDPMPGLSVDNYYIPISVEAYEGLIEVQTFGNMSGLVDLKYNDLLGDEVGQFYALTSSTDGSYLRVLKKATSAKELAKSGLPVGTKRLWALNHINDSITGLSAYILLSADNRSFLLKAGEKIEEETENVGFLLDKETLDVMQLIYTNEVVAYSQVTAYEIRVIKEARKIMDWKSDHIITKATHNGPNLLITLASRELMLFKQKFSSLDEVSRIVLDVEPLCVLVIGNDESALGAVGFADQSIKLYSLSRDNPLMRLTLLSLNSLPTSMVSIQNQMLVGLQNGFVCRYETDRLTGAVSEGKLYNLGEQSKVTLLKAGDDIIIKGRKTLFYALNNNQYELTHSNISSDEDGIRAIAVLNNKLNESCLVMITDTNQLRICQVERKADGFIERKVSLDYMGRQLIIHPEMLNLIILESQNRTFNKSTILSKYNDMIQGNECLQNADVNSRVNLELLDFGAESAHWVSKIVMVNPTTLKTIDEIDFTDQNNKHVVKMQLMSFKEFEGDTFLVVSIVEDHEYQTNKYTASYINIYGFDKENKKFEFINTTRLDAICHNMSSFKGRVLLGVGSYLRLYDLGKKQLLKKCEYKKKYKLINNIRVVNNRIFITDAVDSVHMIRYNDKENQFQEISDDILPRYITALEILDYHTVAVADKFGSVTVLRLPQNAEEEYSEDFASYKFRWESGYLNGAPSKFTQLIQYYYINTVTSMQKVSMYWSQSDVILLGDIEGRIIALLPFANKSQVDFFNHLEMYLRMDDKGFEFVTGRDHLLFRSYYAASKGVIDGDLCNQYLNLSRIKQESICSSLDIGHESIVRRLEEVKEKLL